MSPVISGHDNSTNNFISLDHEMMVSIIKSYDDAWHALKGSIFTAQGRADETRDILARRIVEIATYGERDPVQLRRGALQYFGMAG